MKGFKRAYVVGNGVLFWLSVGTVALLFPSHGLIFGARLAHASSRKSERAGPQEVYLGLSGYEWFVDGARDLYNESYPALCWDF